MAPVAPLLMAGMKYLPVIGAVAGGLPGLRRGNLGEAALGAGLGAATGGLGTAQCSCSEICSTKFLVSI